MSVNFENQSRQNSFISQDLISIRDLSPSDIPFILNYWFRSPPGFVESIGADPLKLPPEDRMRERLDEACQKNSEHPFSKLHAVVIVYDGTPVGFHTISPLTEGDFGVFHAHIWNPKFRGQGLAFFSYPMACSLFITRFGLKRILFKTPAQNQSAIRVKEKLGIRQVGEEVVDFGLIKTGTRALVFELTASEVPSLLEKVKWSEVDMSQLFRNLEMSPDQRMIEHQNSLDLVFDLEEAGRKLREKSQ